MVGKVLVFIFSGQDIWLDIDNARDLLNSCRKIFPRTGYAYASMPTYAGGQIGFVMASTNPVSNKMEF